MLPGHPNSALLLGHPEAALLPGQLSFTTDLQLERSVEIREDDMAVLHSAPRVLDGIDGGGEDVTGRPHKGGKLLIPLRAHPVNLLLYLLL